MSYQQCTRFWTTLDFDREYLWNGSSNQQAENGVNNYDFFHVQWKHFGKLWSTNEKVTLKFNRVGCWCCQGTCSCKISSSWGQRFISNRVHKLLLPHLPMAKNPKIPSRDLDLWPMTSKFSGFRAVVEVHVHAKFHQAVCSGSWVIVVTEKTR